MKCLSLFSSMTVATCLGLNSFAPVAAADYRANDGYYGSPTNQLRDDARQWAPQARRTEVPWYEKLPGIVATDPASSANYDAAPSQFANRESYGWPSDDSPYSYARQQHKPVIGEVEALPQSQHAFDSIVEAPGDYPQQGHPQQTNSHYPYPQQTTDWTSKQAWGSQKTVGNRLRQRIGSSGYNCGVLWQAAADIYFLQRTTTSPVTILVDDTTRSIEEFNTQALDFDHDMGYGVRLSRDLGCGSYLDIGYFGVFDQQAAIERTGDLALVLPGFATGGNPAAYNMDYQSELHSGEVNIRQNLCGRFNLLAGLRYINLNEDLLISSQLGAVVTPDHLDIGVDNNLFGAQLGTGVCLLNCGALQIDALVKCGFYYNDASVTTRSSLIGQRLTANNNGFAMAGEVGLYGTYCINNCWSVRGGIQALGLNGLALAPEQLGQANLATDTTGINTAGTAIYTGATLGVQYAW